MKSVVVVFSLMAATSPAAAEDMNKAMEALAGIETDIGQMKCGNEGKVAQLVFLDRQNGKSPSAVLRYTKPYGSLDMPTVVDDAYAAKRVRSYEELIEKSEEFRNKYELACLSR